MGGTLCKEDAKSTYTYTDYREWELKKGERYELIHGKAFAMDRPGDLHQSISGELFKQIAVYLTGKPCKVRSAPYDVRLFYAEDESDDTVVQPDISIICDEKKRGPEGCRGAPDFVAEILSHSNTAEEMGRKLWLYREAGVMEYWVISPSDKTLETYLFDGSAIHFRAYASTEKAAVGIFPDLTVDLEAVFAG